MVWVESKDLAHMHIGPYWFTLDDRRVVIVKGEGTLAAQFVLLGKNVDVQSRIADEIRPRPTPLFATLREAEMAAEAFLHLNDGERLFKSVLHDEGGEA